MRDVSGSVVYRGETYRMVFSLDVMEAIQEEYGSFTHWGDKAFGEGQPDGEPNVKALKFGLMQMLNEGIRIENEDEGTNRPLLTVRQVGRILNEIGLAAAASAAETVISKSTDTGEKNASTTKPATTTP